MKSLPDDFDLALLAPALVDGWALSPGTIDYAPVGFGSYHWYVSDQVGARFFVTLDDLDHKPWLGATRDSTFQGLSNALGTAVQLQDGCGLEFVVAPLPTVGGGQARRVSDRYAVAVYPLLTGTAGHFGDVLGPDARGRLVDLLARLHRATPPTASVRIDVPVPGRRALEGAMRQIDRPWHGGPYSEPARQWLADHASLVRVQLAELDRLAARVGAGTAVVTHGEPHPGNVLDVQGQLFLIDWDTVAMAPPERDLSMLADDAGTLAAYASATGHEPDPSAMALYRLAWDVNDIAAYVTQLRAPHEADEDSRDALTYLTDASRFAED
jgi:spectinomycin phosphotransferase